MCCFGIYFCFVFSNCRFFLKKKYFHRLYQHSCIDSSTGVSTVKYRQQCADHCMSSEEIDCKALALDENTSLGTLTSSQASNCTLTAKRNEAKITQKLDFNINNEHSGCTYSKICHISSQRANPALFLHGYYHRADTTALHFPMISCPSWRITRLPLSPETQELDHKTTIPPINTVISYRNIQGVTNGVAEGVRGEMCHILSPRHRPWTQTSVDLSGGIEYQ